MVKILLTAVAIVIATLISVSLFNYQNRVDDTANIEEQSGDEFINSLNILLEDIDQAEQEN